MVHKLPLTAPSYCNGGSLEYTSDVVVEMFQKNPKQSKNKTTLLLKLLILRYIQTIASIPKQKTFQH